MQVKFFYTIVLSQHFYAYQGDCDSRKMVVFPWAFASEFNELKKSFFE